MTTRKIVNRRLVLRGTTAIVGVGMTQGVDALINEAFACHKYVSPVDGRVGCGALSRDQANGTSSPPPPPPPPPSNANDLPASPDCNSTPTNQSPPPPPASPPSSPPPPPPPAANGPDPLRSALINGNRFVLIWSKCETSPPYGPNELGGREGMLSVRDRFTVAFYVPPQQHAAGANLTYNVSAGYDFASEARNAINVYKKQRARTRLAPGNVMSFNVEGGNSGPATYEWGESADGRARSVDWMKRYARALRAEAQRQGLPSLGLSNYNMPRLNGIHSLRRDGIGTIAQRIANDFRNLDGTWSTLGPFAYCYPNTFNVRSEAAQREWTRLYIDFYGELSSRLPNEAGWVPWLWPYLWQPGINKWNAWPGNFYNHFLYPDVVYDFLVGLRNAGASGVNFWTETCDRTQQGGSTRDTNKVEAWHQIGLAVAAFARDYNVTRVNT